jgi:hypothetical protein
MGSGVFSDRLPSGGVFEPFVRIHFEPERTKGLTSIRMLFT